MAKEIKEEEIDGKYLLKFGASLVNDIGSSVIAGCILGLILPPHISLPLKAASYFAAYVATGMYNKKADEFINDEIDEAEEVIGEVVEYSKELLEDEEDEVVANE